MSRTKTVFRCNECGAASPKWVGRCAACGEWNSLVEEFEGTAASGAPLVMASAPVPITELVGGAADPVTTHIGELDRVLGGGLVPGSVTLLGGEPGIGKSTLLIDVASRWAGDDRTALYVTAEESAQQVHRRAERIGALEPRLFLSAETLLPAIVHAIEGVHPSLVVIDSVQTIFDPELGSAPGSVAQVRECAHRLVRLAKQESLAVVLVGHVTKDGSLAGPRVLEHVVDTVLSFEGERHGGLRMLRAAKHRFGSTAELGLFEMTDAGLLDVTDPSRLFLADRRPGMSGSVVVPTLEGQRPLLVEVQALVGQTQVGNPRRAAQGLDNGRLAMLLAVIDRCFDAGLGVHDVYASVVGGVRLGEPGVDLALALAVVSSAWNRPLPPDVVVCGEIGLGGELRQVSGTTRRLTEAARLGYRRAIVPASSTDDVSGIASLRAGSLLDAVHLAGLFPPERRAAAPRDAPVDAF